jgi:hypothetical protein
MNGAVDRREVEVRRVGIASVAKMYAAISAAAGLLIGLGVAIASFLGAGIAEAPEVAMLGPVLGIGAIIILPLFYACIGAIAGAIGALLYNAFAAIVGGVRVEVR